MLRRHPAAAFAGVRVSLVAQTSDSVAAHAHAAGLDEALPSGRRSWGEEGDSRQHPASRAGPARLPSAATAEHASEALGYVWVECLAGTVT